MKKNNAISNSIININYELDKIETEVNKIPIGIDTYEDVESIQGCIKMIKSLENTILVCIDVKSLDEL